MNLILIYLLTDRFYICALHNNFQNNFNNKSIRTIISLHKVKFNNNIMNDSMIDCIQDLLLK
jgi:uncharacterized protein (UPF0335 family)